MPCLEIQKYFKVGEGALGATNVNELNVSFPT